METKEQEISGCLVINKGRHQDERGFWQELHSKKNPIKDYDNWMQTNWQVSNQYVVRGIHWCSCGKLITCVSGKVFFVVVDLRPGSSTFKKWMSWWLRPEESTQIYVPPLCGSGYFAAEKSIIICLQEAMWSSNLEQTVFWQDPSIDIKWPAAPEYILSSKDKGAKLYDHLS